MSSDNSIANAGDSIADAGDSQARLERMKNEFLVAQLRRGKKSPVSTRPDDTEDGPLQAGPADERMTAVAAVRPRHH